jgi:hypothetical protein
MAGVSLYRVKARVLKICRKIFCDLKNGSEIGFYKFYLKISETVWLLHRPGDGAGDGIPRPVFKKSCA